MFEASQIVFGILDAAVGLQSFGLNIQPVISDQDSDYPILNYAVAELAGRTKDGLYSYSTAIRLYHNKYDEAMQIMDAVKAALIASDTKFIYNGTQEPQPDAFGEIYIESNYQFNK